MWLSKDERRLLAGYYTQIGDIETEKVYRIAELRALLRRCRHRKQIPEYDDHENDTGGSGDLESMKRETDEYIDVANRIHRAHRLLAERGLLKIRPHQHEHDVVVVGITLDGYDLGRRYSNALESTAMLKGLQISFLLLLAVAIAAFSVWRYFRGDTWWLAAIGALIAYGALLYDYFFPGRQEAWHARVIRFISALALSNERRAMLSLMLLLGVTVLLCVLAYRAQPPRPIQLVCHVQPFERLEPGRAETHEYFGNLSQPFTLKLKSTTDAQAALVFVGDDGQGKLLKLAGEEPYLKLEAGRFVRAPATGSMSLSGKPGPIVLYVLCATDKEQLAREVDQLCSAIEETHFSDLLGVPPRVHRLVQERATLHYDPERIGNKDLDEKIQTLRTLPQKDDLSAITIVVWTVRLENRAEPVLPLDNR